MSTTIKQKYGPVTITVAYREYSGGGTGWEFAVWRGNRLLRASADGYGREVDALAGAWAWVSDQDDCSFLEPDFDATTWRANDDDQDDQDDDLARLIDGYRRAASRANATASEYRLYTGGDGGRALDLAATADDARSDYYAACAALAYHVSGGKLEPDDQDDQEHDDQDASDWPTEPDGAPMPDDQEHDQARFVVDRVLPLEQLPQVVAGAPLVGDVGIVDAMCIRCHYEPLILVEYETNLPGTDTTEYCLCPACWAVMKMGYR